MTRIPFTLRYLIAFDVVHAKRIKRLDVYLDDEPMEGRCWTVIDDEEKPWREMGQAIADVALQSLKPIINRNVDDYPPMKETPMGYWQHLKKVLA